MIPTITADRDAFKGKQIDDADAFYAKAGYDFSFAKLGVDYTKFQEGKKFDTTVAGKTFRGDDELLGVDLAIPFGKAWNVQGEYVKNTTTDLSKDDA